MARTRAQLRAAIRDHLERIGYWRRFLRRQREFREELLDALDEANRRIEALRELRREVDERHPGWSDEEVESRRDEISHAIEGWLDLRADILLRLDERKAKSERAKKAIAENREDIERLRKAIERLRPEGSIDGTHFTWEEAYRNSWYPEPQPELHDAVVRHAHSLERFRAAVNDARRQRGYSATGIVIISWVRSPAKNAAIGGASQSRHMAGDATDHTTQEMARLTPWDNGATALRLIEEIWANGGVGQYPGGNRHMDDRGYRARWTSF